MSDNKPVAIVLLSGGLDSATVLAIAARDFQCHTLSFDYAQRSLSELNAAELISGRLAASHQVIRIDDGVLGGSALTDSSIHIPEGEEIDHSEIPSTYVPARNTLFLAHALAVAEVKRAADIFIGVNAVDYSGYPDCRPEYIEAFQSMANLATKAGVEGTRLTIHTPLIDMSKADIISMGHRLGLDYSLTVSCYQATQEGLACGVCDSCLLRKQGFEQLGLADPTRYI